MGRFLGELRGSTPPHTRNIPHVPGRAHVDMAGTKTLPWCRRGTPGAMPAEAHTKSRACREEEGMEAARVRVLAAMGGGVIHVAQFSSLMTEFEDCFNH